MKIKIKVSGTSAPSSPQIVASIDDLLTEILLRLPVKSLIRFKSVSKRWHSIITNPTFCFIRTPKPNPAIGLFLRSSNFRVNPRIEYVPFSSLKNPPFRKLKFTKDPSGIGIVQSCNGLLLCSTFRGRDHNRRYYVYNPTTNKYSTLPKLDVVEMGSEKVRWMYLAFDPSKSPHYKVVCVRGFESDTYEYQYQYQYQFEVYSSETGPWRKCGEPFMSEVNFENGVYWNGAVHWINNGSAGDSLYYDIDNQMLRIMPMPPIPNDWDWRGNYYFGESCDHLHYIEVIGPQVQFNVYEMRRDYSEWFIKYRVDLSPVVAAYPGMTRNNFLPTDWYYYAFSIFCLVRGEKDEGSFLVLQIPGRAIRYDLVVGTFETIHEFEGDEVEGSLRFSGAYGYQYIESLCCV